MSDKAALLARLASLVAVDVRRPLTERLCDACRQMLGGDGASVTIAVPAGERITLSATDAEAAALEDLQEVLGEGPVLDAYSTGAPVHVTLDDAALRRWPRFSPAAVERVGHASLSALPMRPGAQLLGVLSLYRSHPGPLQLDPAMAQFLSDALGAALLRDPLNAEDTEHSGAWANRSRIHQATGMVVAQLGVPVEDALAIMRAHAFAVETTMDDLTASIIERRLDFRNE
jgi:hypothetical protein